VRQSQWSPHCKERSEVTDGDDDDDDSDDGNNDDINDIDSDGDSTENVAVLLEWLLARHGWVHRGGVGGQQEQSDIQYHRGRGDPSTGLGTVDAELPAWGWSRVPQVEHVYEFTAQ